MEEIEKKIEELGGIRPLSICDENVTNRSVTNFETFFRVKAPELLVSFIMKYGAVHFNNSIYTKSLSKTPISEKHQVHVGHFLSFEEESKCYIGEEMQNREDQIPDKFYPFCRGEQGDLIGWMNIQNNNHGIYYWHHESPPGSDLFIVAEDFFSFFMNMEVDNKKYDISSIEYEPNEKMKALFKEFKASKNKGPMLFCVGSLI